MLPSPSSGDLPDPGIEPGFPTLQADSLSSEPPGNGDSEKMLYRHSFVCNKIFLKLIFIGV